MSLAIYALESRSANGNAGDAGGPQLDTNILQNRENKIW